MKLWLLRTALMLLLLYVAALLAIPTLSPRPEGLGVINGELKPCPGTPNCITTQSTTGEAYEQRKPLPLPKVATARQVIERFAKVIDNMPRTTIMEKTDRYLYAEFKTFAFRFIDDVEIYVDDKAGLIHYRSASRLGRKDFGANGKRMNNIINQYQKLK